jgi:hypothetical protein
MGWPGLTRVNPKKKEFLACPIIIIISVVERKKSLQRTTLLAIHVLTDLKPNIACPYKISTITLTTQYTQIPISLFTNHLHSHHKPTITSSILGFKVPSQRRRRDYKIQEQCLPSQPQLLCHLKAATLVEGVHWGCWRTDLAHVSYTFL